MPYTDGQFTPQHHSPNYAGLGGAPLPVIPLTEPVDQLTLKVDTYNNPGKYGISVNQEGLLFLAAVAQGFVPNTAEGLGLLLAWMSGGSLPRQHAKLFDFMAFLSHELGAPLAGEVSKARANGGADAGLWVAALERAYNQTAPPPSNIWAKPVVGPVTPPPTVAGLEVIGDESKPSPYGNYYASMAWRAVQMFVTGGPASFGPWVSWKGASIKRSQNPLISFYPLAGARSDMVSSNPAVQRYADTATLGPALNSTGATPPSFPGWQEILEPTFGINPTGNVVAVPAGQPLPPGVTPANPTVSTWTDKTAPPPPSLNVTAGVIPPPSGSRPPGGVTFGPLPSSNVVAVTPGGDVVWQKPADVLPVVASASKAFVVFGALAGLLWLAKRKHRQ